MYQIRGAALGAYCLGAGVLPNSALVTDADVRFLGLPAIAYLLLLSAGVAATLHAVFALHFVAGALTLLLVVGIRNAWTW